MAHRSDRGGSQGRWTPESWTHDPRTRTSCHSTVGLVLEVGEVQGHELY